MNPTAVAQMIIDLPIAGEPIHREIRGPGHPTQTFCGRLELANALDRARTADAFKRSVSHGNGHCHPRGA